MQEYTKTIGLSIKEVKGEADHIHFILETKPTDKLSNIVGCLKSKTASFLYSKYTFPYWGKLSRTIWSSGYFVCSTGGVTIDVLKQYIKNQNS
jgi:putative transposase